MKKNLFTIMDEIKQQLQQMYKAAALQMSFLSMSLHRYEDIFRNGIATSDLSAENLSLCYLDTLKNYRQVKLDLERSEMQLKMLEDGDKQGS